MRHSGQPRVVITGIGVVSPFGIGRDRFWHHVRQGCSGTRAITDFDASGLPRRSRTSRSTMYRRLRAMTSGIRDTARIRNDIRARR
jgi:3-oxoacyl-(acyl-carrier-protein) synthase